MKEHEPIIPIEPGYDDADVFQAEDDELKADNASGIYDDYVSSDVIYKREIGEIPMLGGEEKASLLESAANGDPEAKEKVISANLRLVIPIAGRYVGHGLEFADLVQSGNEGLIHAADRFDPSKGIEFSTFATYCISGYINRAIDEQGSTIRVPVHVSQDFRKLKNTYRTMLQDLGRDPTEAELAEKMNMSPKNVKNIVASRCLTLPIDNNIGKDSEAPTFAELVHDTKRPLDEQALINSDIELLIETVRQLPERERTVMELRYLIGENAIGMNRTEKEVGDMMRISRDAVSNASRKAVSIIKAKMGDKLSASY